MVHAATTWPSLDTPTAADSVGPGVTVSGAIQFNADALDANPITTAATAIADNLLVFMPRASGPFADAPTSKNGGQSRYRHVSART